MMEWNAFTLQSTFHAVLQHPDCPACAKKKTGPVTPSRSANWSAPASPPVTCSPRRRTW